ncbi:MAG: hypothetical protein ACJARI_004374, partial [Bacteroidia bacterium]
SATSWVRSLALADADPLPKIIRTNISRMHEKLVAGYWMLQNRAQHLFFDNIANLLNAKA